MSKNRQYQAVLDTIALGDEFYKLTSDERKQKGLMLKAWFNLHPNKPFRYKKCICTTENINEIFEITKNFIENELNETDEHI